MGQAVRPGDPDTELWLHVPGDWRRPAAAEVWDLWRDRRNGFAQLFPRPRSEDIPGFYDVADYYTHAVEDETIQRVDIVSQILFPLSWRVDYGVDATSDWWASVLPPGPLDILELGCGDGGTLAMLAARGHRCTGVEPDPPARIAVAERGLVVMDGTAEDIPTALAGLRFDCVLMLHVLEHCLDPFLALANVRSLLRPGGIFVVEVPNNACRGAALFGAAWPWLDVPRHLNFFTTDSLTAFLKDAGFTPGRIEHTGYSRQFSDYWDKNQRHIATVLHLHGQAATWRRISLLAITAFARPDRKYDSVRITCTFPQEPVHDQA